LAVGGRQVDEYVFAGGGGGGGGVAVVGRRAVPLHGPVRVHRVPHAVDVLTNHHAFVRHHVHQLLQPLQTFTRRGRTQTSTSLYTLKTHSSSSSSSSYVRLFRICQTQLVQNTSIKNKEMEQQWTINASH